MNGWRTPISILALTCALTCAPALALPTSDGPWYHVTVTDGQGWTMRDVTLILTEDAAAVVMVRADGAEKEIAFADLAEVLDATGHDITEEVVTGFPAEVGWSAAPESDSGLSDEANLSDDGDTTGEPDLTAVPGTPSSSAVAPEFEAAPLRTDADRRHRGRSAPMFGFALDLGGGAADVTGDWFWGADDGGFLQGGLRLGTGARQHVHFIIRDQSLGSRTYAIYGDIPGTVDLSMQSYQLLLGHHTARRSARGLVSLGYFEIGGGLMRLVAEFDGDRSTLTRFAFAAQTGLWFMVRDDLAIDAGLHAFYKPGWMSDNEAGGTSLGLHLGAMYVH